MYIARVRHCVLKVVVGGHHLSPRFSRALTKARVAAVTAALECAIVGRRTFRTLSRCVVALVALFRSDMGIVTGEVDSAEKVNVGAPGVATRHHAGQRRRWV